jgi:hypothetical protein
MVTWLLFGLLLIVVALAVLLALALGRVSALGSRREESCCEDCDDWMDIADVVSDDHAAALSAVDDHFAEDYVDDGFCLEGFTPEQTAVLRANYLPLCDDERIRLGVAFLSIVEGADR